MRRLHLLASLLFLFSWSFAATLELHFLDVGQGTAALIVTEEGRAVLYDGGPPGTDTAALLKELGVTELTLVVASHGHADHIGGLPDAVSSFRPAFYMDNGIPHTTLAYTRLLEAVQEAGSQLLEPVRRTLNLDGAEITVIPPPGLEEYGQNDNSIGLRVDYGAFTAVLPGDAERALWDWWLTHEADLLEGVDVFLASHHGSRNGDTRAGLSHMNPDVVVISLGRDNQYGHPHEEAFDLYAGAEVLRTDVHGTITVTVGADGSYTLTTERMGEPAAVFSAGVEETGCVDLNAAELEELQRIVHIGPARALAVVEWRPFRHVEDLGRVKGIGAVRLAEIVEQGKACVLRVTDID